MKSALTVFHHEKLMTSTSKYKFEIVFMVKSFLIAWMGGFLGSGARFLVARYNQISYTSVVPWRTFLVNIVGSLLIGIFFGISQKGNFMSPEWWLFFTVGFCGGFTTFSLLPNDAFLLIQVKDSFRFATYSSLSFMSGLLAVFPERAFIKII